MATDRSDPEIQISTTATLVVINVNEGPTGIHLNSANVAENTAGAVVGTLEVADPDADGGDYEFLVSDPRFTVDGNTLRLLAGESLNFEREARVDIQIIARERTEDFEAAADFALSVLDRDDAPTAIVLSGFEVEEETDGALIGEVHVVDEDNEAYDFTVSDPRFEIVDQQLKLRDGVQLTPSEISQLDLAIVATSRTGVRLGQSFPIQVIPPRSPWQNPRDPNDVNDDGTVTPIDVLLLVNELNRGGTRTLPPVGDGSGEPPGTLPDVNGDGILSAIDVLLIINELNGRRGEGEGSLASETSPGSPGSQPEADWANLRFHDYDLESRDLERRRQANSEIDAELVFLLDQISRDSNR
ncbi:MAG: dockerin type I domain-containing protein [Pirellulaceae bacterium]